MQLDRFDRAVVTSAVDAVKVAAKRSRMKRGRCWGVL
jgi:hypothetical protein